MNYEDVANLLLGSAVGRIAVLNLIRGLEIGQFGDREFRAIMLAWFHVAKKKRLASDQIAGALAYLVHEHDILKLKFPELPDPHLIDRRKDMCGSKVHTRAAVRDALYVPTWANVEGFDDDGLDFRALPGTSSYSRFAAQSDRILDLELKANCTITNPRAGERAILFVTLAEPLWSEVQDVPFERRADFVRDELGLVHMETDKPQILIFLPVDYVEERSDRGRPTVIDSGGNPRFVSQMFDRRTSRSWGETANLSFAANGEIKAGRLERVCGTFPSKSNRNGISLKSAYLGCPKIPRGDYFGVDDEAFSQKLEQKVLYNGVPLRAKFLDYLKGKAI